MVFYFYTWLDRIDGSQLLFKYVSYEKHYEEYDIGSSKSKVAEEGIAEASGAGVGQITSLVSSGDSWC